MFDNARLRRTMVALAGALLVMISGGPARADRPVGDNPLGGQIAIPCGAGTLGVHADWYLPAATPRALIWLQHGFARSAANVADLGRRFADAGYLVVAPNLPSADADGCTLQNVTGNTAFLAGIANLFEPGAPTGLTTALAAAARTAGRAVPAIPDRWVFVGHSAGGEAVEYVADQLLLRHPALWPRLRGLILLDPVASFVGDNTAVALTDLDTTSLPILTVSGPAGLCNNFGSGTAALQTRLHRPYVGVRLPGGVHTDAEGTSSDVVGELFCGAPRSDDIGTLQTLATGWAHDFVSGARTPGLYPDDTAPQRLAAAPDATVLTDA